VGGLTRAQVAASLDIHPDEVTKLSSNENPIGPSPAAVAALADTATSASYYPTSIASELHEAIGRYLRVDAEQVVSGSGSSTLMHALVEACTEPGGEVVWLDPGFTLYQEIARVHRRRAKAFATTEPDFVLDPDELIASFTPETQLVFITRPNNPTSVLVPLDDFRRIAIAARQIGAVVVSDEAYIEFADDPAESAVELLRSDPDRFDNVIVSRTFSKAFALANLRLGYMVGSVELVRFVSAANAKWPTGEIVRAAGIAALADGEHLARTKAVVASGRTRLAEAFEALGFGVVPNAQGNYIMVDVRPRGWTAEGFAADVLDAAHVLVRGDFSPTHVRISIGTVEDNDRLIAGVERLLAARAAAS
jgi:histidinol-phosphate aminotransferase